MTHQPVQRRPLVSSRVRLKSARNDSLASLKCPLLELGATHTTESTETGGSFIIVTVFKLFLHASKLESNGDSIAHDAVKKKPGVF